MERRQPFARLVDSHAFTTFIIGVIVANAVVLGLQTYDAIVDRRGGLLESLDLLFLGVFCVELILRIASYRNPIDFFRSGWNVFDFVVIALAFTPGLRESTTLLRLARLARVVRVVRLLPDLRVLLVGVIRSLPPLGAMAILVTLILFVYGMVGWSIFGESIPEDWGDIGTAMLTLFVMLTLENFPVYMDRGMEVHPWSWIYFVSFVLIAAFIVINVLIGIVLNSLEEAREIERRRRVGIGVETADFAPAPVMERMQMLRAALDELEQELAAGHRERSTRR
jgi:voltage-gated sodium channel